MGASPLSFFQEGTSALSAAHSPLSVSMEGTHRWKTHVRGCKEIARIGNPSHPRLSIIMGDPNISWAPEYIRVLWTHLSLQGEGPVIISYDGDLAMTSVLPLLQRSVIPQESGNKVNLFSFQLSLEQGLGVSMCWKRKGVSSPWSTAFLGRPCSPANCAAVARSRTWFLLCLLFAPVSDIYRGHWSL